MLIDEHRHLGTDAPTRLTHRELVDKYDQLDLPLNLSSIDQGDYYCGVGRVTKMLMMLSRALGKK